MRAKPSVPGGYAFLLFNILRETRSICWRGESKQSEAQDDLLDALLCVCKSTADCVVKFNSSLKRSELK